MRKLKGIVVSDAMAKTRIVAVERLTKHPRYHKYRTVTTRFSAHDEANEYRKGDAVVIQEGRPRSKTKRWTIVAKIPATT
jgi:small subunit ribosomal protein S17